MERVPMTVAGHKSLEIELQRLKAEERPRIIAAISEARAHGDLSENAEYHAAKEQQGLNEARVAEMEDKLSRADVIDTSKMSGDTIKFGATVTLNDEDSGDKVKYTIVGDAEATLREGKISLDEAYARVEKGEVWLLGADIPEYKQASVFNHKPKRARKVLMHRSEIQKFANRAHEKGLTLVPLKVFFSARGQAKLLLGLCKGKKLHDKRETLKRNDAQREIRQAVRKQR